MTDDIHQGIVESLSFSEALAKRDAEIERLRERAGVADAHWHDLRATALTLAKEADGIDRAQALAGHASARMTEAYVARRAAVKVRPIR